MRAGTVEKACSLYLVWCGQRELGYLREHPLPQTSLLWARSSTSAEDFLGLWGSVSRNLSGGGSICRSPESLPEPVAWVALEPELQG